MATKDEEIEQLKVQIASQNAKLEAVGLGSKGSGHAVQPLKEINKMTVLEYDSWRLDELNAKYKQCDIYAPTKRAAQEKEYLRLIDKLEKKFIEDYSGTMKVDANHAKSFSKQYETFCKKHGTKAVA